MLPILDLMIRLLCDKGRVQEALEFVRCAVGKFDLIPMEKRYPPKLFFLQVF